MTEKQQAILNSALKLFSNKGFDAVPTSAIAKDAGVSEGLIFRHFENKVGLLNAIMQMGKEKLVASVTALQEIEDPAEVLLTLLETPFHMDSNDYPFWRLVYSLKWQNDFYDDSMSKPIRDIAVKALEQLKYEDVEAEADLIMSYMDGFATTILLKHDVVDKNRLLKTLRKKYAKP